MSSMTNYIYLINLASWNLDEGKIENLQKSLTFSLKIWKIAKQTESIFLSFFSVKNWNEIFIMVVCKYCEV